MQNQTTLLDAYRAHAESAERNIRVMTNAGSVETYSRATLWQRALSMAAALQQEGLGHGDRALIVAPDVPEFLSVFGAVQILGAIPVPVYPPAALQRVEVALARVVAVAKSAAPKVALMKQSLVPFFDQSQFRGDTKSLSVESLEGDPSTLKLPVVKPDDLALLQYTSGSTSTPRGVAVTHEALMVNTAALLESLYRDENGSIVSWLPLSHDMGLIGVALPTWRAGSPVTYMTPEMFMMDPMRWLQVISEEKASYTAAPNMGYSLCLRRARDHHLESLDLSSLTIAANAAEPIDPQTLEDFSKRFAPCGFKKQAFTPLYGLAESSLIVTTTGHIHERRPWAVTFSRDALLRDEVEVVEDGAKSGVQLVSCGTMVENHELRIVAPDGSVQGPGFAGEIEIRGPSLMREYFRDEDATTKTFHDGWLRTGDRGFLHQGELFICGRLKDVMFLLGKNIHAEDMEHVAYRVPGVRPRAVAAFSIEETDSQTEKLVMVIEVEDRVLDRAQDVCQAVASEIGETFSVTPHEVWTIGKGTLARTPNGKLQRLRCKKLYLKSKVAFEAGEQSWLKVVYRAPSTNRRELRDGSRELRR